MLMPKRVKHRKQLCGSMVGKAMCGNRATNGSFGFVTQKLCWIQSNQIEVARVALTRYTKRGGKVWIRILPGKPVTTKLTETRMGSGKGSTEYWAVVVKPRRALLEIDGVAEADAREILHFVMHKPPCECRIVSKGEVSVDMDGVSAVIAEGDEQSENK